MHQTHKCLGYRLPFSEPVKCRIEQTAVLEIGAFPVVANRDNHDAGASTNRYDGAWGQALVAGGTPSVDQLDLLRYIILQS